MSLFLSSPIMYLQLLPIRYWEEEGTHKLCNQTMVSMTTPCTISGNSIYVMSPALVWKVEDKLSQYAKKQTNE